MSSILKALKKLEDEKSGLAEEKPLNISRDILKPEPRTGINAGWLWFLAVSATVVILILSSALYRTSIKKEASSSLKLQAAAVAAPASSSITPAPISPTPVYSKPAIKASPLLQADRVQQKTTAASNLHKSDIIQKTALPKSIELKAALPETKTAATPHIPTQKQPALTLSGIAWNKDSADRLAIINGQPIATGAVVSGVLVKEILPDKVILSNDGQVFELLIGRSARPE